MAVAPLPVERIHRMQQVGIMNANEAPPLVSAKGRSPLAVPMPGSLTASLGGGVSSSPATGGGHGVLSTSLNAGVSQHEDQLWAQVLAQPESDRLLWQLAKVCMQLRQVDNFVASASELCKSRRLGWRSTSRVLRRLERPQDAAAVLRQAHLEDPYNSEVCCAIAKLVDATEARVWYQKALAADPRCREAILALANVLRKVDGNFGEAAKLYEAAFNQIPEVKMMYRIGECLVQDAKFVEGRHYLMQVLSHQDRDFDMHAVVMIALSYTMAQQHDKALEFCQRAEEIHAAISSTADSRTQSSLQVLLKHAWIFKGITQLNAGQADAAMNTLSQAARGVAGPADKWADEQIESTLGLAATLQGDMAGAERHLEQARRLGGGSPPGPDVLVNSAYHKHVQGNLEAARSLLLQCLENHKNSPMALLRIGYIFLCQDQLDQAAQFLQKCLQQPAGTLSYGAAQKGTAHLYLCIALYRRALERTAANAPGTTSLQGVRTEELMAAEEQFRKGSELLPNFAASLAEMLLSPSNTAASGSSRIGMVDLTSKQATVLLHFAERCGLVPSGSWQQVCSSDGRFGGQTAGESTGGYGTSGRHVAALEKVAAFDVDASSKPPLVGTISTTAPTSAVPSRNPSARDLHGSSSSSELTSKLPPEKVIQFSELELCDCISHGEFTIVHRGILRGSNLDVVVKTLHQKECLQDEQAMAELRAEIAVIAELNHPRIVTFVGACLDPTQLALVTELAPGGNLHQALHIQHRHLKRHERFQLATELLEGVRYLHHRSPPIAHLDLKSMNLVLDAEGQHLQICDFGLARVLVTEQVCQGDEQVDRPLSRGGSPRYMSPECYDSNLGVLTEKADVWSSGCILIEIFGEVLPYAECSNVQQILKLMLVHHCGPSIPDGIEASVATVITSTLAFEASERQSIAQVLLQLQTIGNSASENKSRFQWIP